MDVEKKDILKLELLKHVEETPRLNNRMAASKLGCSVKLAHELLSKMVEKGLFHVKKHHARRWDYFLTPKGITEKARLTYEFLDFSMYFYREARRRSSQLCKDLAESGIDKVSFIGAGDLAEIVYLGVKEWGLELINIYSENSSKEFMGIKTKPYQSLIINNLSLDINCIVCLYDKSNPTGKETRYLPGQLADLQSASNKQLMTKLHWLF